MVWWVEEHYFKTLVICCVLCLWFIAPNLEYHHPLNVIELLQKYAKNYHTDSCSRFSEIRIQLIQIRPWDNHTPPVNLSTLGLLDIWAFDPLDLWTLGPPHTSSYLMDWIELDCQRTIHHTTTLSFIFIVYYINNLTNKISARLDLAIYFLRLHKLYDLQPRSIPRHEQNNQVF